MIIVRKVQNVDHHKQKIKPYIPGTKPIKPYSSGAPQPVKPYSPGSIQQTLENSDETGKIN